jgi:hypothetical protein
MESAFLDETYSDVFEDFTRLFCGVLMTFAFRGCFERRVKFSFGGGAAFLPGWYCHLLVERVRNDT